jgi:hypothetical protein
MLPDKGLPIKTNKHSFNKELILKKGTFIWVAKARE